MGNLIKPNYITEAFTKILKDNHLRHIRFHDLRHTCASILMSNGVPIERVQEWLGHSEIGTTVDIYGHLEFTTKIASAQTMASVLKLEFLPAD